MGINGQDVEPCPLSQPAISRLIQKEELSILTTLLLAPTPTHVHPTSTLHTPRCPHPLTPTHSPCSPAHPTPLSHHTPPFPPACPHPPTPAYIHDVWPHISSSDAAVSWCSAPETCLPAPVVARSRVWPHLLSRQSAPRSSCVTDLVIKLVKLKWSFAFA